MLNDFSIFYRAGQAVLSGQSPYSVQYFFYPPAAAFYFALWAGLPFHLSLALWLIGLLACLAYAARRVAPLWLIFPPVFAQFITGQLDLFVLALWALAGRGSAVALGLMTLKPQIALALVPYALWQWRADYRRLAAFGATTAAVWGLPAVWRPEWYVEWARYHLPFQEMLVKAPTVFGLTGFGLWWAVPAAVVACAALAWAWLRGREIFLAAWLAVNPSIQPYHFAMLAGPRRLWRTVLAGWIAWLVFLMTVEPRVYVIVPLVALWELHKVVHARA